MPGDGARGDRIGRSQIHFRGTSPHAALKIARCRRQANLIVGQLPGAITSAGPACRRHHNCTCFHQCRQRSIARCNRCCPGRRRSNKQPGGGRHFSASQNARRHLQIFKFLPRCKHRHSIGRYSPVRSRSAELNWRGCVARRPGVRANWRRTHGFPDTCNQDRRIHAFSPARSTPTDLRYVAVVSSASISPVMAPSSAAMLHKVIRSLMSSALTALPVYCTT